MSQAQKLAVSEFEAHYAVSTVLSHYGPRDVVSTGSALKAIRWMAPLCRETDEEIVGLIVSAATGRTMSVIFDHR
jgi:hypothetical protein